MFNISEIIVTPCTIMLLTNQDISDKRGPRRFVDVTKDRAMMGQLRERILVFHPACAHTRTHVHTRSASRVSFFSPLRRSQIRSGLFVSPIYVTRRGPSGGTAVSEEGEI